MSTPKEELKEIDSVMESLETVAKSFCKIMASYREKQVFNDSEKAESVANVLEKAVLDLRVVYGEVSLIQDEIEREVLQEYKPSIFSLIMRLFTFGLVGGRR